jgi:hypothetical protein
MVRMPVRVPLKSKAVLALIAGYAAACDSTVNLDYQPRYFDQLLASGMCRAPESTDYGQVDLSLQILSYTRDGTVSLLPDDAVNLSGVPRQVSDILRASDFTFSLSSDCDQSIEAAVFQACAEPSEQPGDQTGISLLAQDLRYETPGGPTRTSDDRLVVLLLDNSGSLKGQPDPLSPVDKAKASDPRDERITFLKNLVRLPYIDSDTYFSLVWFDQRQPHITPEFATPTRNRDVMVCPAGSDGATCQADKEMDGLSKLERGETGATPLADALDQTYKIVINGDKTKDLNPVVVLFTDGVESGDSSGSGKTVTEVTQSYANHTYGGEKTPVPVIVVHLQPTVASGFPRGRDQALYELACATGGEYIFIERADEFTTSDTLEPLVANRLSGAWKLRVSSTDTIGIDPGAYLLSSDLSLTLSAKTVTTPLKRNKDQAADDTRLWFVK